jgi:hypothetical protein
MFHAVQLLHILLQPLFLLSWVLLPIMLVLAIASSIAFFAALLTEAS